MDQEFITGRNHFYPKRRQGGAAFVKVHLIQRVRDAVAQLNNPPFHLHNVTPLFQLRLQDIQRLLFLIVEHLQGGKLRLQDLLVNHVLLTQFD